MGKGQKSLHNSLFSFGVVKLENKSCGDFKLDTMILKDFENGSINNKWVGNKNLIICYDKVITFKTFNSVISGKSTGCMRPI